MFVDIVDRELSIKLTWIHTAVLEKPELTDDGRLRDDSSSADKAKQLKPSIFPRRKLQL